MKIKIVEATIEIFKVKGIKFTMDDIASKLGISKRTIYETVNSKEEVLGMVVDTVFDVIKKRESEILADESLSDIEKLKKTLIVLPTSFETIDYSRIYEVKKSYPKVYEKLVNRLENDWEPTNKLIEQCIEKGEIKPIRLHTIKTILIGSIRDLLDSDYMYTEHIGYQETLEEIIEIIFEGLIIK